MSPFYSKWCFSEWRGVVERVRYPTRANPGLQGSINEASDERIEPIYIDYF